MQLIKKPTTIRNESSLDPKILDLIENTSPRSMVDLKAILMMSSLGSFHTINFCWQVAQIKSFEVVLCCDRRLLHADLLGILLFSKNFDVLILQYP